MTTVTTETRTTQLIAGLHHVTAITGDAQKNADFYTNVLGLRMVKVTINYDDPQTYHLYFGDSLGRPGTAMTFFAWQGGRRGVTGTGQVSETAFAVPVGAGAYWTRRLGALNVKVEAGERFGGKVVRFRDPDGLPLALVETADARDEHVWVAEGVVDRVPAEYAIRGFYGVTLLEANAELPVPVVAGRFGYREVGREEGRVRYEATLTPEVTGRVIDVVTASGPRARMGVGEVHHVAFRTPSDEQQALWLETLLAEGHPVSPVMERDYFRSIYFREPGGVLFEIATDGPGFAINEPVEALGTTLVLPAWLESQRREVEVGLPPLRLAEPVRPLVAVVTVT